MKWGHWKRLVSRGGCRRRAEEGLENLKRDKGSTRVGNWGGKELFRLWGKKAVRRKGSEGRNHGKENDGGSGAGRAIGKGLLNRAGRLSEGGGGKIWVFGEQL